MAKIPVELEAAIRAYRNKTPWFAQWSLIFAAVQLAIPLIVIALAIALGITIGEAIAILCTDGKMPWGLQWLCYTW